MNSNPQIDNFWYGIGTAWPDAGAEGLWRACWQGGLLLLGIWILCRLFPRMSVGTRHWLWWLVCLKLILALVWVSPMRLVVLPAPVPEATAPAVYPHIPLSVKVSDAVWRPLPLLTLVWAVWLIGMTVRLIEAARQVLWLRRAIPSAHDGENTTLAAETAALSARMGLRRPPQVRLCEAAHAPLIFGLFHPCIVLPASFPATFTPEEQRMVLAHELAHLRRRDIWLAIVPMLAQTLFFFLPFVGRACREWTLAREALCDAEALRLTGSSPIPYKVMLLKAALHGNDGRTFVSLGITSGYQTLSRRLALLERLRAGAVQHRKRSSLALVAGSIPLLIPWQLASPRALPPTYQDVRQTAEAKITAATVQTHPSARYRLTNLSLMYPGLRSVLSISADGQIVGYAGALSPSRRAISVAPAASYLWLLDGKGGWQSLGQERMREGLPDLGARSRDFLPQPCLNAGGDTVGWQKTLSWNRYYDSSNRLHRDPQWNVQVSRFRAGQPVAWNCRLPGGTKIFPVVWNHKGEVAGFADVRMPWGQATHAFLYDGKTMRDLGALDLPYASSEAYGLNARGEVVGSSRQNGSQERAFVYRSGRMIDLNTLIPPHSGWILKRALAINEAGCIIGSGSSDAMLAWRGVRSPLPINHADNGIEETQDIFLLTPDP